MLRNGCRFLVLARTLVRIGGLIALLLMQVRDLPPAVLVLSSALLLCGVWVSIPHRHKLPGWILIGYFAAEAAVDAANLLLIRTYYPLKIGYWVTALTGNVLDVIVSAVCIYLLVLTPGERWDKPETKDAGKA